MGQMIASLLLVHQYIILAPFHRRLHWHFQQADEMELASVTFEVLKAPVQASASTGMALEYETTGRD